MGKIFLINPYRDAGHSYTVSIREVPEICVGAIWSRKEVFNFWLKTIPKDLVKNSIFADEMSFEDLLRIIENNNPLGFIAVDDEGFELADKLQNLFFPNKSNDPNLQDIRKNKFEYLHYLKTLGLIQTDQVYVTQKTIEQNDESKLRILKPINGSGNENVFLVKFNKDIRRLVQERQNCEFLLQDYVEGEEYCVEVVSSQNTRKCTTIMKYGRMYWVNGVSPWRYDNDLIDPKDCPEGLVAYAFSITQALGVYTGVVWLQIRHSLDKFNLIEANFRSQGHGHRRALLNSTGYCYSDIIVNNILGRYGLFESLPVIFKKKGEFKKLSINNRKSKFVERIDFSKIEKLNSVIDIKRNYLVVPGFVNLTTGFKNNLATILLQNTSTLEFEQDLKVISEWQTGVEY